MKNRKTLDIENTDLIELNNTQCSSIEGGGWISYALGYLLGSHNSAEGRAVARAMHDLPK